MSDITSELGAPPPGPLFSGLTFLSFFVSFSPTWGGGPDGRPGARGPGRGFGVCLGRGAGGARLGDKGEGAEEARGGEGREGGREGGSGGREAMKFERKQ